MSFYERLVYARQSRWFGKLAYFLLKLLGVEIPRSVEIGPGFLLHHGGMGVVIHPKTVIGANVGIYPGVTLGRADVYRAAAESRFEGIIVEDGAILGAGAKILCDDGILRVGRGTVIGANAVLMQSTGENEIWAGIPAKKVGERMWTTEETEKRMWTTEETEKRMWTTDEAEKRIWTTDEAEKRMWTTEETEKRMWTTDEADKRMWTTDEAEKRMWTTDETEKRRNG